MSSIPQNCTAKKRLNHFERFNFVIIDNIFHNINLTILKNALSSYQRISPSAPQSDVCSYVWTCTSSKSPFLHQKDLKLYGRNEFPIFQPFIYQTAKNLAFYFPCCKIFTLYSSMKIVCKLPLIQTSNVPHCYVQVSCTTKRLLCGFELSWGTKWDIPIFPINKNSQLLNKCSICQLNI